MTRQLVLACLTGLTLWCADPAISVPRMRADLDFLTAPEFKGRVPLQDGAAVAARFIAAEFVKAGLRPCCGSSFLQEFEVVSSTRDTEKSALTLERDGKKETLPFTGSHREDVQVSGDLVFAGYGITAREYSYDDYGGIDARGKIVVILDREPAEGNEKSAFLGRGLTWHANARIKRTNAQAHGAVAVLSIPSPKSLAASAGTNPRRGSAGTLFDEGVRIPMFTLGKDAATKVFPRWSEIQDQIDRSGRPASQPLPGRAEIRVAHRDRKVGPTWNVIGLVGGSDPRLKHEFVLITSHYDHLPNRGENTYPGANDNGSGTVAVLEIARALATLKPPPKRTIGLVSFGAEENGLLGSYYYVAHPLAGLNVKAVINLDMIGRDEAHTSQTEGRIQVPADTSNLLNLVGGIYFPGLLGRLQEANRRTGLQLDLKFDQDPTQNTLWRCDHFPFLVAGIPAMWLFGGWHPGYHEPSDTADRINWVKMEKVARLAMITANTIANDGVSRPGR